MRFRIINNNFISSWVFSLLIIVMTSALATEEKSHTLKKVAEQTNPWVLPQVQERSSGYQGIYNQNKQATSTGGQYRNYQYQEQQQQTKGRDRANQSQRDHRWQPQVDRFVTPEFLESLKRQQSQQQIMPENQHYQQYNQRPSRPRVGGPDSMLPGIGDYGYPSYGRRSVNPLYDTPAVSPWGGGPDVLHRGESFPLVPSEALGGFSPMHVPSFGMQNQQNNYPDEANEAEADDYEKSNENNVFNPFTFLP